jgi:hypothetical protein
MRVEKILAPITWPSSAGSAKDAPKIFPQFDEDACTLDFLNAAVRSCFTFNGETYQLGKTFDWLHNPSDDIEWHILLHKFYYAPGLARAYTRTRETRYRQCFQELLDSWIEQVPVGYIAADVTARRVQNWIYAWQLFDASVEEFGYGFKQKLEQSISDQVDYLMCNLAPARNHRTLELYAIFLASVAFPDLSNASAWRELSCREMLNNIGTDLLDDGVHCELATDYHHIVLRSYLLFYRLARANDVELPQWCDRRICQALDFSMHVHRPDGMIPALSDSDSVDYRELLAWGAELFNRSDYAFVASSGAEGRAPEHASRTFETSGYAILRSAWDADEPYDEARYLVFDAGPVGAGNHGHFDALNIEVAASGRPLIVDPGRYTYHADVDYDWRTHFRSTRSHNTVTVDGCSQAIYQCRSGRNKLIEPLPQAELVSDRLGSRIPYLCGRVSSPNYAAIHSREIWFPDTCYFVLRDQLRSTQSHHYELCFQLAPWVEGQVNVRSLDGVTEISVPGLIMLTLAEFSNVSIEPSWVSTRYGEKVAAPRICISRAGVDQDFFTVIYPYKYAPPTTDVVNHGACTSFVFGHDNHCDYWSFDADTLNVYGYSSAGDWRLDAETNLV